MACKLAALLLLQGAVLLDPVRFRGHTGSVYCVRFSADGKLLFSGSRDGTVRVWNPDTGRQKRVIDIGRRAVHRMDFTPDQKTIYLGDRGGELAALDVVAGKVTRVWRGHDGWISALDVRPDGRRFLSAASDKSVKFWDLRRGIPEEQSAGLHMAPVRCAAYDRKGARAASGDEEGWVKVWDPKTGKEIHAFRAHTNVVGGVEFSADGRFLATCGTDCCVWDLEKTDKPLFRSPGGGTLRAVDFSPDGKYVAAGGKEDFVRIFDARTGKKVAELFDEQRKVDQGLYDLEFSPVGMRLAVPHLDRLIRVWTAKP